MNGCSYPNRATSLPLSLNRTAPAGIPDHCSQTQKTESQHKLCGGPTGLTRQSPVPWQLKTKHQVPHFQAMRPPRQCPTCAHPTIKTEKRRGEQRSQLCVKGVEKKKKTEAKKT